MDAVRFWTKAEKSLGAFSEPMMSCEGSREGGEVGMAAASADGGAERGQRAAACDRQRGVFSAQEEERAADRTRGNLTVTTTSVSASLEKPTSTST